MIRVPIGLAVLALVAVTLAGEVGRVVPVLDVVNHLRLPWLAAGAAVLLLAALARCGRLVLLAGGAALAGQAAYVVPEVLGGGARAEARPELVVASHNMRFEHADLGRLNAWVEAERVDVLILQEVPWHATEVIAAISRRLPHGVFGRWNSVLILSRHPLDARLRGLPRWTGPAGGAYPVARIQPPGRRPIDVVGFHATHPAPLRAGQDLQFDWLAGVVGVLGRDRIIVAGDFNLTPFSHRFDALERKLALGRATVGLRTFPTRLAILPIDHIWHGGGFATVSAGLGPDTGSDHLPVVARFVER